MSKERIAEEKYDVFLCYNHENEAAVKEIGRQLKERKIAPWFAEWDIRPGMLQESEIWRQTKRIPAAAVFIGKAGINRQQELEISALLREFMRRDCPVIPVLLKDAPNEAELPYFLDGMRSVDFRLLKENPKPLPEEDPLNLLVWGITGDRPWKTQQHVLIASLGESPVAVSAMYDLLTQKGITIDQVIVLHPMGEDIGRGYGLVKEALAGRCQLRSIALPFEDVNSWGDACLFLKELYTVLDICQIRGDRVYLSLAGGRKSMAALMAWVVPFFSCVEHLYHVFDPDEENFLTINELDLDLTPSQRALALHPDLDPLILVDIPFERGRHIDQQLVSRLLAASDKDLEQMGLEEAEKADFVQTLMKEGTILEAMVTERVITQFEEMRRQDSDAARRVRDCLERMQSTVDLRGIQPDTYPYTPPRPARSASVDLHLFESFGTPVRAVFYTRPRDIYTAWDHEVEQVVICELDTGKDGHYRSLQEIATAPGFSIKTAGRLEKLPLIPPSRTIDSVLIVPLGESPMVATQLFTLLKRQENHRIHKVILVYPEQAREIANGAKLIQKALREEAGIPCIHVRVPGLADIDSPQACQSYQAVLEATIEDVRQEYREHPEDYTIDLALSGGRKGMTAMTIFAAQNKQLSHVYHTLITDDQLNLTIDDETTFEVLNDPGLSRQERNDRLFLRAYESEGSEPKFILFKVPVFPPG